ncbi:energy-coupling factor ABC transporter ATP-binding protein [Pseudothermotoga sp.]
MLELSGVCFSYADGFTLKNICLRIEKGSFVLLVGANGSGKTTLLKILAGLLPIRSGFIRLNGKVVGCEELREYCCYVFHNPFDQIVGSTVEEDIAFGLENLGLSRSHIRDKIERALRMFNLSEKSSANPLTLSGGTAQKLAVASMYVLEPEVFLLDEPTSMLDDLGVTELKEALKELNRIGKTIIVSTHEPRVFFDLATCVVHMIDGSLDFHGNVSEFLGRQFDDVES